MAQWAVVIPADRWATERLFHHDTVTLASARPASAGPAGAGPASFDRAGAGPADSGPANSGPANSGPVRGDEVLLVAGDEPQAVALGVVRDVADGALLVAYTRRAFDAAVPADELALTEPITALEPDTFARLVEKLGGDRDRQTWLVSLDLPIEAASPAEAVRQFWSYVQELGPAELPTYVSPYGDELAMQAFVLGAEANLDPEEDDD